MESSKQLERGLMGEKIISEVLQKYLPSYYRIIDDIFVRTEDFEMTQVDHLLIHPQFIVCIETKNLSGALSSVDEEVWEQKNYKGEVYSMNSPQLQSLTHTMHLTSFLTSMSITIPIYSVVVLLSNKVCQFDVKSDMYYQDKCPVLYGKELVPFVLKKEKELQEKGHLFDVQEVTNLLISEHQGIMDSPLI
ncbi:hypothetical protein B5V88_14195 [Heyndrickxia sporothermodurans]|uniref:NERD domain-containing protein n=1 Tax=Heyndrickxia sporothermodurans TaxID=46224 RepID=A0A150L7G1_9BACI|nr:nuclease-related domain-containing protein [Heyndrickxia sporothermodurans]KYD08267.1 hypothetical protein B4102_2840 [Heyndrickxia sporothermodurans]MBL5768561.1 NERD domain-containing protein [Heyndrickxia sporothermodurans]MBL5772014.1 NERD domain-containing protein [Heyndrickxia sporothermodurans]MBL5775973.1 NERD domain-containing protein [Heyndrickxia sporothermodurans]MBL5782773.1 NERD domain-containing protein [Heyndrickxia sporothermodurans]